MKKLTLLFCAALFAVQFVSASHTIVVSTGGPHGKGKTEVSVIGDTISVTTGLDVTAVEVSVINEEGQNVSQETVPAVTNSSQTVTVPTLPVGYIVEIRDDHGVVYSETGNSSLQSDK